METRKYKVAEIPFEVILEGPWKFMSYSPVVAERIAKAARGEVLDIVPCRAGDKEPARTFVRTREELSQDYDRYCINMSQYEPFRAPDSLESVFSLRVCEQEPEWVTMDKENGKSHLVMKVDEQPPHYFVYTNEGRIIFEFEAEVGNVVGTLCISKDFRSGEFYPKPGRRGSGIIFQIGTALMIMFTYAGAYARTLLMHSSVILHNGMANMFLGTSGTGKSTHSRLWLDNVEGSELVNDDNPALQVSEDGKSATIYGTPWSGKTPCYRNISVPVRAIVMLHQAPKNELKRIEGLEAFLQIISSASAIRWDSKSMDGITGTAEKIAGCVACYNMNCLPDADAALTCLNYIEK